MPRISDFAVIRRDSLQLQPQDADGNLPVEFSKTFDLPNVSESDDDFAILSFMANPSSNADLRMRFFSMIRPSWIRSSRRIRSGPGVRYCPYASCNAPSTDSDWKCYLEERARFASRTLFSGIRRTFL